MNFEIIERVPAVEEFAKLRNAVGWGAPAEEQIEKGLNNSVYSVCAVHENEVIGFARIIGDGAFAFYIQDVIVLPKYQNNGVGSALMDKIIEYINNRTKGKIFVGLMCAKGKEEFYKRYGFIQRPTEGYGPGMFRLDLWERE